MRCARLVPLAALAAHSSARAIDAFEPQDFNVAAALEKIGVDVATLPDPSPETSGVTLRSFTPCSLAVRLVPTVAWMTQGCIC